MQATSGPDLDRRIAREVLKRRIGDAVPAFSEDDNAATALAQEISRETGWKFELSRSGGVWSVTWIEDRRRASADPRRRKIGALVTACAPTRPLAICRALLKAARSPRWPDGREAAPVRRAAGGNAAPLAS